MKDITSPVPARRKKSPISYSRISLGTLIWSEYGRLASVNTSLGHRSLLIGMGLLKTGKLREEHGEPLHTSKMTRGIVEILL